MSNNVITSCGREVESFTKHESYYRGTVVYEDDVLLCEWDFSGNINVGLNFKSRHIGNIKYGLPVDSKEQDMISTPDEYTSSYKIIDEMASVKPDIKSEEFYKEKFEHYSVEAKKIGYDFKYRLTKSEFHDYLFCYDWHIYDGDKIIDCYYDMYVGTNKLITELDKLFIIFRVLDNIHANKN